MCKRPTLISLALLCIAALSFTQHSALAQLEHAADCDRLNSSRLPSQLNCGQVPRPEIVMRHELDNTLTITTPEIVSHECAAQVEVQYLQNNTLATVEGTIENDMCAASSGTYVLSIRTRDDNNELTTQEFTETWAREDAQAAAFEHEYEIGENAELVRIRVAKITCTCAGAE